MNAPRFSLVDINGPAVLDSQTDKVAPFPEERDAQTACEHFNSGRFSHDGFGWVTRAVLEFPLPASRRGLL